MIDSYWGLVGGKWFILEDGVISFMSRINRNRHDLDYWRMWWATMGGGPWDVMRYYPVDWPMSDNLKRLAGIMEPLTRG